METLVAATLYARKDPRRQNNFCCNSSPRQKSAEASSSPDAFALFDAAYLTEAYNNGWGKKRESGERLDGLPWIKHPCDCTQRSANGVRRRVITLRALRLIIGEYAQLATAGAKNDELLSAIWRVTFFGEQESDHVGNDSQKHATKAARQ